MKKHTKYVVIAVLSPLLVYATADLVKHYRNTSATGIDTLALLLPDDVDLGAPAVHEWLDAADEEGLHLVAVHDSDFLNPLSRLHASGVILPDQLHRTANDSLIGELYRYVNDGGNLMVVYDACTWDLNGRFLPGESRLSSLVGVKYALYDRYGTATMAPAQVTGTASAMRELGIPPGSFSAIDSAGKLARWRPVAESETSNESFGFATYIYGAVDYPVFHTLGDFDGEVLLKSKQGIAAGYRQQQLGEVLFVNLPLGYLASRTDALLLHSFLHFFAVKMARLPYLASVPDGVGGLVFNWHVDARSSLRPLKILADAGVFDRGKFSVHFTAGPDVDVAGDHKGLDIDHDPEAQKWIRYLAAKGQQIGSHGGWMHNYFGYNLSDSNEEQFEKYLVMNRESIEHVTGTHLTEYSAPVGNHPAWVTRWLEKNGFLAYYFTGDAGLGPTRVYRGTERDGSIWAFPILHMGKEASLEEMGFDDVPTAAVREWMLAVTDFAVRQHAARLVYAHPFGAERFFPTIRTWLDNADDLEKQGRFRWYTMTGLAQFLKQRELVHWTVRQTAARKIVVEATHPESLAGQTWIFPAATYGNLRVLKGDAAVRTQDDMIFVAVTKGRELTFEVQSHPQAKPKAIEAKR